MSRRLAAVLLGVVGAACANHAIEEGDAAGSAPGDHAPDTLRGVVAITGADPLTQVVLRPAGGAPVTLTGPIADSLRGAVGLVVVVAGRRDGSALEPRTFRVAGLDDLPAADGRLEIEAGAAILVTADGERLRYPGAPEALRRLAGRHVWIAGEPGREPQQWGVLAP
ncbi:MAG TPA: hypothetical protein VMM12_09110 [Longimicrobiales bacterium]|nr:hypothetical protein [Longimicrobiales bacterium]